MKLKPHLILAALTLLLPSCVTSHRPKQAVSRTTITQRTAFGASPVSTVTETPYESPAYTASGVAMFSRP